MTASKGGIVSKMRWFAASIAVIALTVFTAAWMGSPRPFEVVTQEFDQSKDLDLAQIEGHIKALASAPSRISGSPGARHAAEYLAGQLRGLGVDAIEEQTFEVAVPVVEEASLTSDAGLRLELHPLWPNLARTSQTAPDGVSGVLLDVGSASEERIAGQPIRDSILLMDWDVEENWLGVMEFGCKAIVFSGDRIASGAQARKKFLTVPANIPRFYVRPEDAPLLRAQTGRTVSITCRMDWQSVSSRNLFAQLTQGSAPSQTRAQDRTPIIFHAYYDAISVTPTLAPGAEQACGAAVLLELARYVRALPQPPPRPIYLLFSGAHGQHMTGMTRFVRTLADGLERGWTGPDGASLMARMGRPGLFVGLDLSSGSDRIGLFCAGGFRAQAETQLRPKFSALAMQIDAFAKGYMSDPGSVSVHSRTSFVDCVNLTMGRAWWTYFPFRTGFESEIPTLAGLPGVTLGTIDDGRRLVDTPDDTLSRMRLDMLAQQIRYREGEYAGLANLALAFAYWKGPFVSSPLENKMCRVEGRVVWLDSKTDYTPNRGLAGGLVALKTYRNDRQIAGLRAAPVMLTAQDGSYVFDGLVDVTSGLGFSRVVLDAFGAATRRFLEQNPDAIAEYRAVMSKLGNEPAETSEDGAILFAIDQARPQEQPFRANIAGPVQYLSPVVFPCKPITLYGLTEPRGFLGLQDVEILDVATNSAPFQFGVSYSDDVKDDIEENCITLWTDPTLRVRLTLGLGAKEKRLLLINNSPEDPIGKGYKLQEIETIPSWTLDSTRGMWHLDEERLQQFARHGVRNARVESLHREASGYLEVAESALESRDYAAYRQASERCWALETGAYGELLSMANNMIRGVLFYLLLLLPFSYCLERLVLNAGTISGRIWGMTGIFVASFVLLAIIHPAFRFTLTPMLVLIAFIILSLAVSVSALVLSKFDRMLIDRKQATLGAHEDIQALGNVAMRSLDLGIANIRRRPQRAFLTGLTIVLVTFTLLSFTSIVPETGISRLRHRQGEPVYKGLLSRDRTWAPLPAPLYESLQRAYGKPGMDSVVAGRAWHYSDAAGMLSKIDLTLAPADSAKPGEAPPLFVAEALVGMEPSEARISGVAQTLVAGRWFEESDESGVILPGHVATSLGLGEKDLGRPMRLFGRDMPLIGIVDEKKFDALRDIDGEPLTPVNFAQQQFLDAQQAGEQTVPTIREYVHWPVNRVAIVPFKTIRSLGLTLRSVAVRTGTDLDPDVEAVAYVRRSNLTLLACDGRDVTLYASLNRNRLSGAGQTIVPLLLGFMMVLGAMLGSVYERQREIFVYNSVGLSPTHVASLFLAESAVYATLGAAAGYLLGNGLSKLLQITGVLSHIGLNYSAGSTVFVTVLTMGIVLASAIYPARLAFQAALPSRRKVFEGFESDDSAGTDRIAFYLPFVSAPTTVFAMQAYVHEFLESVQGASVGQLSVDDLRVSADGCAGRAAPALHFRAWLAPFDLGISHDAELRIVFREDRGVYQCHLTATRNSGDQQNWRRLLPRFLLSLRKQLLLWRILAPEEQLKYRQRALALFGRADPEEAS